MFLFIYLFIYSYYYLLFCTVSSAIPLFPFSKAVQLLQNDAQKWVLLKLMSCLVTAKWRLGKCWVLGQGYILLEVYYISLGLFFLYIKTPCSLLFVVFLMEKGNETKIKFIIVWTMQILCPILHSLQFAMLKLKNLMETMNYWRMIY